MCVFPGWGLGGVVLLAGVCPASVRAHSKTNTTLFLLFAFSNFFQFVQTGTDSGLLYK